MDAYRLLVLLAMAGILLMMLEAIIRRNRR